MDFEFHITVNDLKLNEKEKFVRLCQEENVKPLMILLDKGVFIHQPMYTGIIKDTTFEEADQKIEH